MLKFGVIGAGRIGCIHAQTLMQRIEGAQVCAVADVDEARAQTLAQRFGIARHMTSAQDVIDDPEVEAVIIASATPTHVPLVMAAAAAGKAIFCEKPLDHDLVRIDAALEAVEKAGVPLMMGFNRRFDANFARLHHVIQSGEIGKPELLHIISRDPGPPPLDYVRASGGLFFDMTIHDFDMARFLLGDVNEVYAVAGVLVDPAIGVAGDVDTALITLRFSSGALGVIDNSRRAIYGYDQRAEVMGSNGAARSENRYANEVTRYGPQQVSHDLPLHFFLERYTDSYEAELRTFVKALNSGAAMPVTGADGRAAVLLARAAQRSYLERRPVLLREVDRA